MTQFQEKSEDWLSRRESEDYWNSVVAFKMGMQKDEQIPNVLGGLPDWLSKRRPVSSSLLRLMMFLFVFSVGFIGASSMAGNVDGGMSFFKFGRLMIVPLLCVFNFLVGFFANQLWFVPKLYFKRKFKLFVLVNFLYTVVSILLRDSFIHLFHSDAVPITTFFVENDIDHPFWIALLSLIIFLTVTVIICAFNVLIRLGGMNAQAAYVKKVKDGFLLQADLAFLKQQLSPHFLFNTLNNISALIDIDPALAQKSMNRLSSVLRQMLNEAKENLVGLDSEIEMLKKYCELEKLRFGENMDFSMDVDVECLTWKISPLLMLPLVENAFKYGEHPSNPCRIAILILEKGGLLKCHVENTIVPKATSSQTRSGIGLANLKRRLNVCYPGRFEYETKVIDGNYIADLQIDLKDSRG